MDRSQLLPAATGLDSWAYGFFAEPSADGCTGPRRSKSGLTLSLGRLYTSEIDSQVLTLFLTQVDTPRLP